MDPIKVLNILYSQLMARQSDIQRQFSYFDGDQALVFATDEWKRFHANRYRGFSDNWCAIVVNSMVDRLKIRGIRLPGDGDTVSADEQGLWSDWQRNEMTLQSKQGFLETIVAKRSFTLVWKGAGGNPEVTWESPTEVIVGYVPGSRRQRLAALKAWTDQDAGYEYATLYLPNQIFKYQRKTIAAKAQNVGIVLPVGVSLGGDWEERNVAGEPWPIPNPLGVVPIVEWQNRPRLNGLPISDIDGVIAMQDAVNAMWSYLFPAADHASMPARVILGGEPPQIPILDELGQIIGSRPAKMDDLSQKRFLHIPSGAGQNVDVKQWDPARLDVFLEVAREAVAHVAAQSSTPGHYLLINEKFANLNADALTAAEVPLATKGKGFQTYANPAGKETLALMAGVRGNTSLAEAIRGADSERILQWDDTAMHSESQVADAATKDRAVGLSLHTVLERRYQMTEQEIEREFERIKKEQGDPFLQLDPVTQAIVKGAAGGDANTAPGA